MPILSQSYKFRRPWLKTNHKLRTIFTMFTFSRRIIGLKSGRVLLKKTSVRERCLSQIRSQINIREIGLLWNILRDFCLKNRHFIARGQILGFLAKLEHQTSQLIQNKIKRTITIFLSLYRERGDTKMIQLIREKVVSQFLMDLSDLLIF